MKKKKETEQPESELSREEQLQIEQQAIDALLQYGVKFSVPLKIVPKQPKFNIFQRWCLKHRPQWLKPQTDKRIPAEWDVEVRDVIDVGTQKIVPTYFRNFHVKPLCAGTIMAIRNIYINIEIDEENTNIDVLKYWDKMCEIVALAVINDREISDPLSQKEKEIKKFLLRHINSILLQKICLVVAQMMDRAGFMLSTRLIKGLSITTPTKTQRVE